MNKLQKIFFRGYLSAALAAILVPFVFVPYDMKAQSQRTEAEVITVRPYGFDPPEIRRRSGRMLLVVNNRSGLEEVHLLLDRVGGNRERDERVRRGRLESRNFIELAEGRYRLTEANHPAWICEIVVSNRRN